MSHYGQTAIDISRMWTGVDDVVCLRLAAIDSYYDAISARGTKQSLRALRTRAFLHKNTVCDHVAMSHDDEPLHLLLRSGAAQHVRGVSLVSSPAKRGRSKITFATARLWCRSVP